MTSTIDSLPTEILCTIFELSARALGDVDQVVISPEDDAFPEPVSQEPFYLDHAILPSLKSVSRHCVVLSHICHVWREVAIDFRALWTRVHLGHGAFFDATTTESVLARSGVQPLSLHLEFPPHATLNDESFQRLRAGLEQFMPPTIPRCRTLRLEGVDIVIMAALDTFLDHMLSNPFIGAVNSELSKLHIMTTSRYTPTSHATVYYPPDLGVIAPNVTVLRVEGAQIATLPRWHLRHAMLGKGTLLSYKNHYNLFGCSGTNTLVLDGALIPSAIPHVRGITDPRSSSITTLVLSALRLQLPSSPPGDDPVANGGEGGQESDTGNPTVVQVSAGYRSDAYSTFFALSLHRTLISLTLSDLSEDAVSGFVAVLCYSSLPTMCPDLRQLWMRGIHLGRMGVEGMVRAFPSLSEVVLEDVGGRRAAFFEIWRNFGGGRPLPEVWPMLGEVILDGRVVLRS